MKEYLPHLQISFKIKSKNRENSQNRYP